MGPRRAAAAESHCPHDWYGESLLMTPVDALDTLIIMRCREEADAARALIDARLSFDKDIWKEKTGKSLAELGKE